MAIYIVVWILVVLAAYFVRRNNFKQEYFVAFAFGLMTFLLALRGSTVGEDTGMYLNIAEHVTNISWADVFSNFPTSEWNYISYGGLSGFSEQIETMYLAYCKVIMSIFHYPQFVLIITAIITNFLIAKFILDNFKTKADVIFSVYIYMCDSLFMNSFNTMRQALAISIAVQSIQMLKSKKYLKALLCVGLASCFHLSALIFLIADVFFLLRSKSRYYKYLLVCVFALPFLIPALIRVASFISPKYASYLSVSFWTVQLRGTVLLWGIIIILLFVMIKSKRSDDFDWWLIYMATLYIGVEYIGMQLTVISRVAMYFRIALVLLFPIATKYFDRKNANRYKFVVFVIMTFSYFSYANSPARLYSFFF